MSKILSLIIALFLISSCASQMKPEEISKCEAKVGIVPASKDEAIDTKCMLYNGKKPDVTLEPHTTRYMFMFTPLFGLLAEQNMYAKPAIKTSCQQKGLSGDIKLVLVDKWYGWCLE